VTLKHGGEVRAVEVVDRELTVVYGYETIFEQEAHLVLFMRAFSYGYEQPHFLRHAILFQSLLARR
jgi:hypothetical protein